MSSLGDIESTADCYPHGYVARLVHELRTPLTALRGSLGLLASVMDDASPEVKSFASIAERNTAKLAGMLDDLAEIERIRGGSIVTKVESVDIVDVVERVVSDAQPVAERNGVGVEADIGAGEVETDPVLLRRALARLVDYAIRMSSPSRPVGVRVARDAGGGVRVEVSDGGKPTDSPADAEIFDPFSLVARRGQDASARSGLGLTISRALADLLGATLTFTSSPEGGLFRLTIPARKTHPL